MDLQKMSLADLKAMAKEQGIKGISAMKKPELIDALTASVKDELKRAAAMTGEQEEKGVPAAKTVKKTETEPAGTAKKKATTVAKASKKKEETEIDNTPVKAEKTPGKTVKKTDEASGKEKTPAGKGKSLKTLEESDKSVKKSADQDNAPRKKEQEEKVPDKTTASPVHPAVRVEEHREPVAAADGIVPHNYESAGGTTFTRPAPQRPVQSPSEQRSAQYQSGERQGQYQNEQRSTQYQNPEKPAQYQSEQRSNQSQGSDRQQVRTQDGRPRTFDGRQQAQPGRPAPGGARQAAYGRPGQEQQNQPSAAVSGKIVSTGRITTEEREALDPSISPDIEQLDSGETKTGILELVDGGYGFIRCDNFLPGENDVYVSPAQIRKFNLKTGDIIVGNTKVKTATEKFSALLYIKTINGLHPSEAIKRYRFEDMTPIFPNQRLHLETPGCPVAMRIVDLISPIGKGQRGMIVSQPKAGKTTLLKQIASAWKINYPDLHLIILLIDERPEEVTDMKESIQGPNVEVIYSTFDELPENHKRVSEMVIERAKRLVEHKKDVVVLLDSITRLARAYNLTVTASGRTLSGGLDPAALHMPKKFFGAARCMREGGSLTILATALVETGSRMDDVVFEEFKGTGNMELVLDRNLSERRIFPAIDLPKSSTRREDLLLSPDEIEANNNIRKAFNSNKSEEAVERIINMFTHTRSNREFIEVVKKTKL